MEIKKAGLIADGLSNKEIAKKLSIREEPVKSELANIYMKLGLKDRYQLI